MSTTANGTVPALRLNDDIASLASADMDETDAEFMDAEAESPASETAFCFKNVSTIQLQGCPAVKAAWDGSLRLLRTLIDGGISTNISNEDEQTPLIAACMNMEQPADTTLAIIRYLRSKDAKLDSQDRFGRTALMYSCALGRAVSITKALLEFGADLFVEDHVGFTALVYAYNSTNEELVRLLSKFCKIHGREMVILETKVDSNFLSYLKIQKKLGVAQNSVKVGSEGRKSCKADRAESLKIPGIPEKLSWMWRRKNSATAACEVIGSEQASPKGGRSLSISAIEFDARQAANRRLSAVSCSTKEFISQHDQLPGSVSRRVSTTLASLTQHVNRKKSSCVDSAQSDSGRCLPVVDDFSLSKTPPTPPVIGQFEPRSPTIGQFRDRTPSHDSTHSLSPSDTNTRKVALPCIRRLHSLQHITLERQLLGDRLKMSSTGSMESVVEDSVDSGVLPNQRRSLEQQRPPEQGQRPPKEVGARNRRIRFDRSSSECDSNYSSPSRHQHSTSAENE